MLLLLMAVVFMLVVVNGSVRMDRWHVCRAARRRGEVLLVLLLLMAVLSMLVVAGWFGRSGWMEWGVSSGSFEFLAMHAWAG